jgi:pimeloyl-ACP methyl ester carboxylesterase
MPVLLLIGDHDIIIKGKSIEKAKELLPHSETSIIKNAGHFLSFDQSETINSRILDFLNQTTTHAGKSGGLNAIGGT